MWSAWSEAAALLVLLAATSPYAAVITGYGILHITESSASLGDCVLANGTLSDLWIGDTSVASYSSSDSLKLVLANSTGVYTATYTSDGFLGVGDGGKVIIYKNGIIDIAGEASVDVGSSCTHPFSAKLNGDELAVACDNVLLYYRLGSSEAWVARLANVSAVLGLGNGTVLVKFRDSVGFVNITEHDILAITCDPMIWGVGGGGVWVACSGEPIEVFIYRGGSLEWTEVQKPYNVCSSAGDPCKFAEGSLYIEELSFTQFEGELSREGVQIMNAKVGVEESSNVPPAYSMVHDSCVTSLSPGFVATDEPVPSRLLVGTAMIVSGLISVLLGYRISKQESVSREG